MSRVRQRNTSPEIVTRKVLHSLGYRFRLHRSDLPGTPDIVLPRHGVAVFVHGCFWHRHQNCKRATVPTTRREFWLNKFAANVARDGRNQALLEEAGWKVLVIWECESRDVAQLRQKLNNWFAANVLK